MSHISNLPLQEMIAGVVRNATNEMASHPDDWAAKLASSEGEQTPDQGAEKTASLTDPDYIEKLASACDFLSANVTHIETPTRGVLGNAIAKMAGEAVPAPQPNGSLEVTTGMAGEQQYKKDKPKAGFDAAASTANTPEGTAGLPGGATQMLNDMESAPGQASGSVPTAEYPKAGVLHAGPTKTAMGKAQLLDALQQAGSKAKMHLGTSARKVDQAVSGAGGKALDAVGQGHRGLGAARAVGYGVPAAGVGAAGLTAKALAGREKKASKGEAALDALRAAGAHVSGAAGKATDKAKATLLQARTSSSTLNKGIMGAKKSGKRYGQLMAGGDKSIGGGGSLGAPGNKLIQAIKHRKAGPTGEARFSEAMKSLGARGATAGAVGVGGAALAKSASAGEQARQMLLSKLAGEDVMKANISASKSGGGALVGQGELGVMDVTQHTSNPTDGSGYGNQQRSMIQSNQAAINYDKGQAKKPRAPELAEVLKNPAFSPKHDGKLHEQLQNTGAAGVKIAGAQMREFLKQAAANGSLTQEMVNNIKVGMDEKGCTCGGEGTCKSCKLETLKSDASKTSMGDMGGAAGGGMGY